MAENEGRFLGGATTDDDESRGGYSTVLVDELDTKSEGM
jgi:hypothetical protein